ncbi:MAG: hypothetical protein IT443_09575 [Phycisphaeraceae bacterium]|nr:hypothetical protein [Phycisphaeraceae bacterium]
METKSIVKSDSVAVDAGGFMMLILPRVPTGLNAGRDAPMKTIYLLAEPLRLLKKADAFNTAQMRNALKTALYLPILPDAKKAAPGYEWQPFSALDQAGNGELAS